MNSLQHILVIGGGYAGFHVARGLRRDVRAGRVRVTVIEPSPYLTYKPLLPEVAGGETHARDATITLVGALRHAEVVAGRAQAVDCDAREVVVHLEDGRERSFRYDHLVFALGAITRPLPIPGLGEHAVGFSSLEEAVYLRNQILDRVRFAATTTDTAARTRALTFVFIGGGYTGVEAIAELHELARHALAGYPTLAGKQMTWLLVEATGRIATELGNHLSQWTLDVLRSRGISVLLNTQVRSCENGDVELSTGDVHPADTIVLSAGVEPDPLLSRLPVPTGAKGHLQANEFLQVIQNDGTPVDGVWALGDNAQVPRPHGAPGPSYYPPNAQNALRQARRLTENLQRALRGEPPLPYRHMSLGTMASYGRHEGAALIKGLQLSGTPAWVVDKLYHALSMPSTSRRIRLVFGWGANALAARDLTSTSAAREPREPFRRAVAEAESQSSPASVSQSRP